MKFKYSFVTNSSSTSFIVLGTEVYFDNFQDLEKLIKKICKKVKTPYKKPDHNFVVKCLHDGHLDQYLHSSNSKLVASLGPDNTKLMIGLPFHEIKDNDIFGCVKDYVVEECKRLFNLQVERGDIGLVEETWYT